MSEIIGLQVKFFLASIASGIIMLIVYDTIRIFRRIIKHSRIAVGIEDVIFWVLSSLFIFVMMYIQNNGIIRGFSIMGMLLGMIMYNQLLSKHIVNGISAFIHWIIKLIKKIISILFTPFRFILKKLKRLFGFIFRKLGRHIKKLLHIIKKLGKLVIKALKNLLKTFKISITKE